MIERLWLLLFNLMTPATYYCTFSVVRQCSLVLAKVHWCLMAEKVTVNLSVSNDSLLVTYRLLI